MLDQNWIGNFYRSIGYPIVTPSKLYEDIRSKIKIVLAYRINTQARPLDTMSTALHELHLRKAFDMVDTRSNIHLADINS